MSIVVVKVVVVVVIIAFAVAVVVLRVYVGHRGHHLGLLRMLSLMS